MLRMMSLILLGALLWPQSLWAACDNECKFSKGAILAVLGASVSASTYGMTKLVGVPDKEEERLPEESSFGPRDFQYRFETNARAMRDGLLRASGSEYNWMVGQLLEVSPDKQPLFRCVLLRERPTLMALLAQAEPGSTANVYDWLKQMRQRVEDEQDPMNRCWLAHRVRQSPTRFAQQLTSDYQGEHFQWLTYRYLGIKKINNNLFICHLRAERQKLIAAFEQVNHPEKKHRPQGLHALEQSLNRIKSKIENNTQPAGGCALSESVTEPESLAKP
jgi:hypothetical protein